ncbi:hypothetical protein STEG23_023221, partial [Scotinomys teguina]
MMTHNLLIGSAAVAVVQWAASSASGTRVIFRKEFKGPGDTEFCNLRRFPLKTPKSFVCGSERKKIKPTLEESHSMPESLFYCSLHDPVSPGPAGYVTNKSVSVWGFGGRVEMTVSKFMAIQEALQPDWFQCLSDGEASCAEATSVKRARKSVDRSLQFLDSCLRLQEESE